MRLIAIDTALQACSIAFLDGQAVRAWASEKMERGHAERIAPMAREVMAQAGAPFSSLERIVVTTGPGSFTGVRVGLAFARAMALALNRPCVGVSSLEALALEAGDSGLRAGAIAAPDGVYFALYQDGREIIAPARMALADAKARIAQYRDVNVRGPGASAFGGMIVDAPDIAALARRGGELEPARYRPNPLYLRAPDAKPLAAQAALA